MVVLELTWNTCHCDQYVYMLVLGLSYRVVLLNELCGAEAFVRSEYSISKRQLVCDTPRAEMIVRSHRNRYRISATSSRGTVTRALSEDNAAFVFQTSLLLRKQQDVICGCAANWRFWMKRNSRWDSCRAVGRCSLSPLCKKLWKSILCSGVTVTVVFGIYRLTLSSPEEGKRGLHVCDISLWRMFRPAADNSVFA
jgi:hypothetical protein